MMDERKQKEALVLLCEAILETVAVAQEPFGAPSGVLYAGLMQFGLNLESYQQIMGTLVRSGFLRGPDSHCYHITDAGRAWLAARAAGKEARRG